MNIATRKTGGGSDDFENEVNPWEERIISESLKHRISQMHFSTRRRLHVLFFILTGSSVIEINRSYGPFSSFY